MHALLNAQPSRTNASRNPPEAPVLVIPIHFADGSENAFGLSHGPGFGVTSTKGTPPAAAKSTGPKTVPLNGTPGAPTTALISCPGPLRAIGRCGRIGGTRAVGPVPVLCSAAAARARRRRRSCGGEAGRGGLAGCPSGILRVGTSPIAGGARARRGSWSPRPHPSFPARRGSRPSLARPTARRRRPELRRRGDGDTSSPCGEVHVAVGDRAVAVLLPVLLRQHFEEQRTAAMARGVLDRALGVGGLQVPQHAVAITSRTHRCRANRRPSRAPSPWSRGAR